MHQSEKSVFIIVIYVWSNETRIDAEMNMAFSFIKLWLTFSVHLKSVFFHIRAICYDHTRLRLMRWVKHKGCVVSSMRRRVRRRLDHENVKSILSRLSQPFGDWLLFYIERIVFLMETIVFNSIQVINYWFTLHCTLRPLYQQAQTSSFNIWGISDQNVTCMSRTPAWSQLRVVFKSSKREYWSCMSNNLIYASAAVSVSKFCSFWRQTSCWGPAVTSDCNVFNASDVSGAADDSKYWQMISWVCNLVILCDDLNIMILFLLCLKKVND